MNELLLADAVQWLVRLRDAPADGDVQRAFDAWLARGDAHRIAYLDALLAMNAAAECSPPRSALARPAALRRHAPWLGFAAASLAILAFVFAPRLLDNARADLRSDIGQVAELALADGSRIELDPDSAVRVDLGSDARTIELLRGGLRISVGADPRPLTVRHGEFRVRDIGTRFEVQAADSALRVGVIEGRVEVRRAADAALALAAGEAAQWRGAAVERFALHATATAADPRLLVLDHAAPEIAFARWSARSGVRVFGAGAAHDLRLDAALPMGSDDERRAALDTLAQRYGLRVAAFGAGIAWLRAASDAGASR